MLTPRAYKLVVLLSVLLSVTAASACRSARAATPVEVPNLDVPPPPQRIIEPVLPSEPPELEPVGDLPPPGGGTTTRPKPQRDSATTRPEAKPEVPPEPVPVPPPPPANPTQLRAPGMGSGPETAAEIRAILDRANTILSSRIDYRNLNAPQKASYDTAKRFAAEGEKELKAANYVLAKEHAEKAEKLAKELQGR